MTALASLPEIDIDERCTACGVCIATCPERALLPAPARPRAVGERCTACLACVEVCPVDALDVTDAMAGGHR